VISKWIFITSGFLIAVGLQIILPALFGFESHLSIAVFLIAVIFFFGTSNSTLAAGLIYATLGEMLLGQHLGILSLSFLANIAVIMMLQKVINIRPIEKEPGWANIGLSLFLGLIMLILWWYTELIFQYLLFNEQPWWFSGFTLATSNQVFLGHSLLFLAFIALFSLNLKKEHTMI